MTDTEAETAATSLSGTGYGHAPELAGPPVGEIVNVVALLLIAGADVALFYDLMSIIMRDSPSEVIIWLAVAGFTVASLAVAHAFGRLLRDRVARYRAVSGWALWALFGVWLVLGGSAYVVRYLDAQALAALPGSSTAQYSAKIGGAVLFLVLYVASGAVAALGVYFSRNPFRTQYRTAFRAYQRALRRLDHSRPAYERSVAVLRVHTNGRRREAANHEAAQRLRTAFAGERKQYSGVVIAAHLQDPSATDGMTLPDRKPYPGPPAGTTGANTH